MDNVLKVVVVGRETEAWTGCSRGQDAGVFEQGLNLCRLRLQQVKRPLCRCGVANDGASSFKTSKHSKNVAGSSQLAQVVQHQARVGGVRSHVLQAGAATSTGKNIAMHV